MTNQLVSKRVIQTEFGISPSTLKYWRLGRDGQPPKLVEGVHWLRVGARKTLYNLELMRDFLHNQDNPDAHRLAITAYLESLPSSKATA
jgi:hypothetical protein